MRIVWLFYFFPCLCGRTLHVEMARTLHVEIAAHNFFTLSMPLHAEIATFLLFPYRCMHKPANGFGSKWFQ
jgi:hypothetical protein